MRFVVNLFITSFLIVLYQYLGWISIEKTANLFDSPDLNKFFVVAIVALVFTFGVWLFELIVGLFVTFTFGLGCLVLPIVIFAFANVVFWLLDKLLPGWVVLDANPWQILAMALLVAIVRVRKSERATADTTAPATP